MNNFSLPVIKDRNRDITKQWYIEFKFRDANSGNFISFRKYVSNRIKEKSLRDKKLEELKKHYSLLLKSGWTPFDPDENRNIKFIIQKIRDIKTERTIKRKTQNTYRYVTNKFVQFLEKKGYDKIDIIDFNQNMAFEYMDHCKTRKLKNWTTNNHIAVLKGFFNEAVKRQLIIRNPFTGLPLLKNEESRFEVYTNEELKFINQKLREEDPWLFLAVSMIFFAYIRTSELVRLKIKDFNLIKKTLFIRPMVGKNSKPYTLPLHPDLIKIAEELNLKNYPEENYVFSTRLQPGKKEQISNRIQERWKKWSEKHGIFKKFYALKHTSAGNANEAGINLRTLQQMLRHSSLEYTQIYLDKYSQQVSFNEICLFPSMEKNP